MAIREVVHGPHRSVCKTESEAHLVRAACLAHGRQGPPPAQTSIGAPAKKRNRSIKWHALPDDAAASYLRIPVSSAPPGCSRHSPSSQMILVLASPPGVSLSSELCGANLRLNPTISNSAPASAPAQQLDLPGDAFTSWNVFSISLQPLSRNCQRLLDKHMFACQ